jgi:hypothetical protein
MAGLAEIRHSLMVSPDQSQTARAFGQSINPDEVWALGPNHLAAIEHDVRRNSVRQIARKVNRFQIFNVNSQGKGSVYSHHLIPKQALLTTNFSPPIRSLRPGLTRNLQPPTRSHAAQHSP